MATTRQVLTIGGLSFLTAGLTYCFYFDYKRRHDPAFRKKLLKEQRRLAKKSQAQNKNASRELEKVLAAAVEAVNAEPLPTTLEGKEQFFMEQVGIGEMLASKMPRGAMPAAIAFFKAYKVYPSPQELMIIFQRTMPAEIFSMIVEMIKLDVNRVINSAKSSHRTTGLRRQPSSDGPVIEEITGEERALIEALQSAASSAPANTTSDHSKPNSGHESAPKATSPSFSEHLTESVTEKSSIVDLATENGSAAPSENGSATAASHTANSFVMVDEDSVTQGGTLENASKPIPESEIPADQAKAAEDFISTTAVTHPQQSANTDHQSPEEAVESSNTNLEKPQESTTINPTSKAGEE